MPACALFAVCFGRGAFGGIRAGACLLLGIIKFAEHGSAVAVEHGEVQGKGVGVIARDNAVAQAVYIPAHVWTPHFSLFGAFSDFSTLEECYGDLSGHIHALETGLSSDPPMNRRLSMLDRYLLVSNSDAHSGENLGREANLFEGTPSYDGIFDALRRAAGVEIPVTAEDCGPEWDLSLIHI
mgnify:CR=1 FL=1